MDREEVVNVRNSVWRRISENVSRENVASVARAVRKAFGRLVVCCRGNDASSLAPEDEFTNISKPIYTGPKIEVPWRGEEFKYPTDRYLTNKETLAQLNLLELRFRAQSKILEEKRQKLESELEKEERNQRETMAKTMRRSSLKFAELRNLVKEFKKYVARRRGLEKCGEENEENSSK